MVDVIKIQIGVFARVMKMKFFFYLPTSNTEFNSDRTNDSYITYILDTGCNQHMAKDQILSNIKTLSDNVTVDVVENGKEL